MQHNVFNLSKEVSGDTSLCLLSSWCSHKTGLQERSRANLDQLAMQICNLGMLLVFCLGMIHSLLQWDNSVVKGSNGVQFPNIWVCKWLCFMFNQDSLRHSILVFNLFIDNLHIFRVWRPVYFIDFIQSWVT